MEYSQEDFEKMCRVCRIQTKSLISIFETADNNADDIPNKIMACAEVNIRPNDLLPSKICVNCLESLNASFDFQILCRNSDAFFRESLNERKKVKDDLVVQSPPIKEEPPPDDTEKTPTDFLETTLEEDTIQGEKLVRKSERLLRKKRVENYDDNFNELEEPSVSKSLAVKEKRSYIRRRPLKFHKCEICDITYKNRTDWKRHNFQWHGVKMETLNRGMECSVCHRVFPSCKLLKAHQRQLGHNAKEACQYCEKHFSRSYMSEHLRTHTGEQPFLCTTCGKNFWVQSIFKKHVERCSNMEKKFKCSYCDCRFYAPFSLKVHERIHTKEKPYVCETCGKAFRLKSKLKIHQHTHTDLRPYPCSTCGRKFRQRTHLKEHMRIHTGVKPYVCNICGVGFTQGHSLKTHQVRHAPTQPINVK